MTRKREREIQKNEDLAILLHQAHIQGRVSMREYVNTYELPLLEALAKLEGVAQAILGWAVVPQLPVRVIAADFSNRLLAQLNEVDTARRRLEKKHGEKIDLELYNVWAVHTALKEYIAEADNGEKLRALFRALGDGPAKLIEWRDTGIGVDVALDFIAGKIQIAMNQGQTESKARYSLIEELAALDNPQVIEIEALDRLQGANGYKRITSGTLRKARQRWRERNLYVTSAVSHSR